MIRTLKKIRLQFLKKKKLNNYFSYAFGEIVLVMIGILLALYISNLNEENQKREKERWYLTNITEDLTYQISTFKELQDFYTENITIAKSLLYDYYKLESFTMIDSINPKLNFLLGSEKYPEINNTYTELLASGQFSLIKSKELSNDIIDYYLSSKESENYINNDINNIFYKEVFPVFNSLIELNLDNLNFKGKDTVLFKQHLKLKKYTRNQLEKIDKQLALVNAIKLKIWIEDYHLSLINEMLIASDSLIKKIDLELEK
ncbi:MAG: hypothetical protein HWD85_06660 [Flavobacteriaceae bacterium]|nr:hypothetical protein [Flavobacteriaceae bacterium]